MTKSKLEKKIGFVSRIQREIEEIEHVGFGHYLEDRMKGYNHHHKEDNTSKDSLLLHSRFYKE